MLARLSPEHERATRSYDTGVDGLRSNLSPRVVVSSTLEHVQRLVQDGTVRVSEHGYDELAADAISVREIVTGIADAMVVEDYPDYPKGPCVLVRQTDRDGQPLHVVWGIPTGHSGPAVVVTAYRPDPEIWEEGFLRRRK